MAKETSFMIGVTRLTYIIAFMYGFAPYNLPYGALSSQPSFKNYHKIWLCFFLSLYTVQEVYIISFPIRRFDNSGINDFAFIFDVFEGSSLAFVIIYTLSSVIYRKEWWNFLLKGNKIEIQVRLLFSFKFTNNSMHNNASACACNK